MEIKAVTGLSKIYNKYFKRSRNMINTVNGKINDLGKTYIHEHIKLDLSGHKKI